jgi:hypothetical protein
LELLKLKKITIIENVNKYKFFFENKNLKLVHLKSNDKIKKKTIPNSIIEKYLGVGDENRLYINNEIKKLIILKLF